MAPEGALSRELVVHPPRRFERLNFRELLEYHELLYFLAKRELQIRYKQSIVGVGWAVLQPLALTAVFTLFFGRLAKVPSDGVPYGLFALTGLVWWLFLSQSTVQGSVSLVGNANLISKVYFPRILVPVAKTLALAVDAVIALVIVVLLAYAYGEHPGIRAVLLVPLLLLTITFACGIATLLAALNVKYRDVTVLVPVAVQMWLFATPVIYPGSLVTGAWQYVYALNPAVSIIGCVRWLLLDTPAPSTGAILISAAVAAGVIVAGVVYFRSSEHFFADLI